jgi:hypothetical protein
MAGIELLIGGPDSVSDLRLLARNWESAMVASTSIQGLV